MTIDSQVEYKIAQDGGHHVDCDGWRIAHRLEYEREKWSNEHCRVVCVECGPLHIGSMPVATARKQYSDHEQWAPCDHRCKGWDS